MGPGLEDRRSVGKSRKGEGKSVTDELMAISSWDGYRVEITGPTDRKMVINGEHRPKRWGRQEGEGGGGGRRADHLPYSVRDEQRSTRGRRRYV